MTQLKNLCTLPWDLGSRVDRTARIASGRKVSSVFAQLTEADGTLYKVALGPARAKSYDLTDPDPFRWTYKPPPFRSHGARSTFE